MSLSPEDVTDFWFRGTAEERNRRWWGKDAAVDAEIERRFGAHVDRAAAGAFDTWMTEPSSCLALVLLLDQVSRTIHRGDPRSWAYDAKAREVVTHALAAGHDQAFDEPAWRTFLYMPLMHSESLADQERCMELFTALAESAPSVAGNLDFAKQHRDIVARFGRFPHRNAILGRESTPEESAFLEQPGSSF